MTLRNVLLFSSLLMSPLALADGPQGVKASGSSPVVNKTASKAVPAACEELQAMAKADREDQKKADSRLDRLVKEMEDAKRRKKDEAMERVVLELVKQHRKTRAAHAEIEKKRANCDRHRAKSYGR